MTQSSKLLAVIAAILAFATASLAQTAGTSADETVTSINTTLHTYPTLEFVDSGCAGYEQVIAISEDRRSLTITQNFASPTRGRCDNVQAITVPIFSLDKEGLGKWSKQGQHTSFVLECINRVDCFSRRSDAHTHPEVANNHFLQVTAPDQVSHELRKAIQHLLDSLLTEASARINSNSPAVTNPAH